MNGLEQLRTFAELHKQATASPEMEKQAFMRGAIKLLTKVNPAKAGLTGAKLGWGSRLVNQPRAALANTLFTMRDWTYAPWMNTVKNVAKWMGGKNKANTYRNRLYNWAAEGLKDHKLLHGDIQRFTNWSHGYGNRLHSELGLKGTYNEAGRFVRAKELARDANGNIITREAKIPLHGPDGKPLVDAEGKPIYKTIQQSKYTTVKDPNAPNAKWDLGRFTTRALPFVALSQAHGLASELKDSDNPVVSAIGTGIDYLDPFYAIPTAASQLIRYPVEWSAPLIKNYYRSKYYDAPPNLLAQLYKTFNPTGYADYLKKTVNNRFDEYFSNDRTSPAVVRDLFTGKLGDTSTPKSFFGDEEY